MEKDKGIEEFFKKLASEVLPNFDCRTCTSNLYLLSSKYDKETKKHSRYYLYQDGTIHLHDLSNSVYSGKDLGEISDSEYSEILEEVKSKHD